MKKVVVFVLMMGMLFTLVACGGGNKEANNKAMQAKIDEVVSLGQEIIGWYEGHGYLEGETAVQGQEMIDKITTSQNQLKASHQEQLDKGGYTDEDVARISVPIDETIAAYKKSREELKKFDASAEAGVGIAALSEKHNTLVDLVNEAAVKAEENGWVNNENFMTELESVKGTLESVGGIIEGAETVDDAKMNELVQLFDEQIEIWRGQLAAVSEPYTEN